MTLAIPNPQVAMEMTQRSKPSNLTQHVSTAHAWRFNTTTQIQLKILRLAETNKRMSMNKIESKAILFNCIYHCDFAEV